MSRKPWELDFTAEPEEVAALRRVMRLHLWLWGLHEVADAAQLCVSELVSNIIKHVGVGTPATLAVSMNGRRLRIELHDPDTRFRPTLVQAGSDSEAGRGMAIGDAIADGWGVLLRADRKVTWCELAMGSNTSNGHVDGAAVARAEALLSLREATGPVCEGNPNRLSRTLAAEAASDVIVDVLHWLRARDCDEEEVLDRAQIRFEAQVSEAPGRPRRAPRRGVVESRAVEATAASRL
ncbi:ATP-binding protein [Streptomyces sp. NPDC002667]|uniref:ATP-binding protein n=1 Tax=Streptomyces sp. NPDC002667 TaxID=3364657 RepID=UPI0036A99448